MLSLSLSLSLSPSLSLFLPPCISLALYLFNLLPLSLIHRCYFRLLLYFVSRVHAPIKLHRHIGICYMLCTYLYLHHIGAQMFTDLWRPRQSCAGQDQTVSLRCWLPGATCARFVESEVGHGWWCWLTLRAACKNRRWMIFVRVFNLRRALHGKSIPLHMLDFPCQWTGRAWPRPFRPHVASPGSWGVGGDLWLMAESNFNEDITNINQQ